MNTHFLKIHVSLFAQHVSTAAEPAPITATSKGKGKTTTTATTTEYEVLNPQAAASPAEEEEEEEEGVPEMTPSIEAFSKLPLGGFSQSWEFIKGHRDVVVAGASDALLVAAFRAERAKKHQYAKQCIHQSLLLQYSEKLGRDGVAVFFRKYVKSSLMFAYMLTVPLG